MEDIELVIDSSDKSRFDFFIRVIKEKTQWHFEHRLHLARVGNTSIGGSITQMRNFKATPCCALPAAQQDYFFAGQPISSSFANVSSAVSSQGSFFPPGKDTCPGWLFR